MILNKFANFILTAYKIFSLAMITSFSLIMYNPSAFEEHAGKIGLSILIVSILCMIILILILLLRFISFKIEIKIQISTYFLLTGLGYLLLYISKTINTNVSEILYLNTLYFIFGLIYFYTHKIYKENIKKIYNYTSFISIIISIIIPVYIENYQNINRIIIENKFINAIIKIVSAGPSY